MPLGKRRQVHFPSNACAPRNLHGDPSLERPHQPPVVHQHSRFDALRGYVYWKRIPAPLIHDPESDARSWQRSSTTARNFCLWRAEDATVTVRWYVLTRLKEEFTNMRTMMAAQLVKESVVPAAEDSERGKTVPVRAHSVSSSYTHMVNGSLAGKT